MSGLLAFQRVLGRALSGAEGADILGADAARRIAVHRTTIESGLALALANVFPAVRRVIGAPTFALLAADFIATAPPRRPVLATYGRDFPSFISTRPIGPSLPYLEDLARLEWLRQESYLAADAEVLDASRLNAADSDALSAVELPLHPATQVISSPFPVHKIWRLNQPDVEDKDIPAVDMKIGESVIVTRPRNEVVTRAVDLADATLVRALGDGASLGDAVTAACAISPDFDVTRALAGHFAAGTFANP